MGVPLFQLAGFGRNATFCHWNIGKCTNFYKKVCFFCICVVYYLGIKKENVNL